MLLKILIILILLFAINGGFFFFNLIPSIPLEEDITIVPSI